MWSQQHYSSSASAMMHQRNYNTDFRSNNYNYNYNSYRNSNVISVKELEANLRQERTSERTLFPHGDPFTWVRDSDFEVQRGLWHQPVWTHPENRSIPVRAGGYTGNELLQTEDKDILTPCLAPLYDLAKNVTPEPWQLISPMSELKTKPESMRAIAKEVEKSTSSKNNGDQNGEPELQFDFSDLLAN